MSVADLLFSLCSFQVTSMCSSRRGSDGSWLLFILHTDVADKAFNLQVIMIDEKKSRCYLFLDMAHFSRLLTRKKLFVDFLINEIHSQ